MSAMHCLKCRPEYFKAIADGRKTWEVRKNDRDYQLGDRILFREYNVQTGNYTGCSVYSTIIYLANLTSIGCEGFVGMTIRVYP